MWLVVAERFLRLRLQPAGKAQMDAKAFMNGFSEWLKDDAIFEGLNHE